MSLNKKEVIKNYLLSRRGSIIFYLLCVLFWSLIGYLSDAPLGAMQYTVTIWIFFGAVYLAKDSYQYIKRYETVYYALKEILLDATHLPDTNEPMEALYQEMLIKNLNDKQRMNAIYDHEKMDMEEYYSMWVHQIKTPIAGMSLLLQATDCEEKETLQSELFRVEQYVDMALTYSRLQSESNDLVLKEYETGKLVRKTVKKFANQFIYKKISLCMEELDGTVLTDAKWLGFVLEQLISNALKYTNQGSIAITCKDNAISIADTGIGIAKEDLPRIFEKGYTGYNGRMQQKSTGIGLYLCKQIMEKLSGQIMVESTVGEGSCFTVVLPCEKRVYE